LIHDVHPFSTLNQDRLVASTRLLDVEDELGELTVVSSQLDTPGLTSTSFKF